MSIARTVVLLIAIAINSWIVMLLTGATLAAHKVTTLGFWDIFRLEIAFTFIVALATVQFHDSINKLAKAKK